MFLHSPPLETSLVHIPLLFFVLGFIFKFASLFTLRFFTAELALCCLLLAASGLVGGWFEETGWAHEPLRIFHFAFSRGQLITATFVFTVATAVCCGLASRFSNGGVACRIVGFILYALVIVNVMGVASIDRETPGGYASELASAVPKFVK